MTLQALDSILNQQFLSKDIEMDVCLVDDGSIDGTSSLVREKFPNVLILQGSGNLFWAGGMRFGWNQYVKNQYFDYLLVFNDDIVLYSGVLNKLVSLAESSDGEQKRGLVLVGSFKDPTTGNVTYGGVNNSSWWHPLRFTQVEPSDDPIECLTFNMNFALINKYALSKIGFLSPSFQHAKSDFDYGLRLRAAGGKVVIMPGYAGECKRNFEDLDANISDVSLRDRWNKLLGVKKQPPYERAVYYRRHAGFLWPLYWVLPYLRIPMQSLLYFIKYKVVGNFL